MAERNLENITVTMTKEEKKAIKQAALDNDCSVSELIRRWLEEYRAKDKQE
ncbi:MAG: ribbon-helix-helix protein, CopG family [Clostridia bacterium]|nr:ribbon-helix-helix protein, CopG family [Clostridia bacterium]